MKVEDFDINPWDVNLIWEFRNLLYLLKFIFKLKINKLSQFKIEFYANNWGNLTWIYKYKL
jgi:hypothetical protein